MKTSLVSSAVVSQMISNMWVFQAVYVAAKLGLADLVAERGPLTVEDLAEAAKVHSGSLFRVLRVLVLVGLFEEKGDSRFDLAEAGNALRSEIPGSLRKLVLFNGAPPHWKAWGGLLGAVQGGTVPFSDVNELPFFTHLLSNPELSENFYGAMTDISGGNARGLVDAYSFFTNEAGNDKVVVDVGGAHGIYLAEILRRNLQIRGVLFDLPTAVRGSEIEELRASGRCVFESGSFFKEIPVGADYYLLANILHDWPDSECLKILKNCRKAMSPQSKLLVAEATVPPPGGFHPGSLLDLEMFVLAGGRERTQAEFEHLFELAGFQLTRVIPTSTTLHIVEAEPVIQEFAQKPRQESLRELGSGVEFGSSG